MLSQHPRTVVIHHSAGMQGFDEIRKQHLEKGYDEIGYNVVIERDGTARYGRPFGVQPAANAGRNADTIAVCLVGWNGKPGCEWTEQQTVACKLIVEGLELVYDIPYADVIGHNTWSERIGKPGHTECPGLSAAELEEVLG